MDQVEVITLTPTSASILFSTATARRQLLIVRHDYEGGVLIAGDLQIHLKHTVDGDTRQLADGLG